MPRTDRAPRRASRLAPAFVLALLSAGCAAGDPAAAEAADPAGPEAVHGFVAGAEELTEAQLRLSYLDRAGTTSSLDLLTGEEVPLGSVGPTASVVSDGRFLFAASEPAGRLTVVDSGTWTVDHGDHTHYYRAEPRVVGTLDWAGDVRVASSEQVTALFSPDTGAGIVLDRLALGQGELRETASTTSAPHDGVLVPLGSSFVSSTGDEVLVLDASGRPVAGASAPCPDVQGGVGTRVGVVVSCADGAVLATEADGQVVFEFLPYPEPVDPADRATSFAQRPGRPAVAAVSGDRGLWLLDSRARSWQLVPTPSPLLHAVAVDDDRDRVVALDDAGRVLVIDPETGVTAATDVLAGTPEDLAAMTVEVDADRAYVNVPSAQVVHEIDYADGARVARTLPTAVPAAFLAETGR
ncbi:YncE family protein [Modestobacter sp. SSW1-42]|uniref:YncE family protein n=1 Tax=Modestobacter sp. SSW1-42 TaxID=596372 RepID=UPI00398754BB